MKKILRRICIGLTVFFFVLTFFVIVVGAIGISRNRPVIVFGYTYSVVPTSSMEPEIMAGDLVFAKVVPYDELTVGDDVIYYSQQNEIFIVHRIIEKNSDGLVMKGINNTARDNELVTSENYIAKVIGHGSFLSIGKLIIGNRGIFFVFIILIFLMILVNEIVNIIRLTYKKKQEKLIEEAKNKQLADLRAEVKAELEQEKQENHDN